MKKTTLAANCAALLLLLSAPIASAQTPKVCKDLPCLKEAIAKMANAGLAKKEFVGMSVVVVDRDKGSFDSHFGYRDLEKKLPATKDTIYEIGSITKPLSFLTLAAQDKIKLDDSIAKYLPKGIRNPQPGGKDIQFKHLVTHTSGLPRHTCVTRKGSPKPVCYGLSDGWENPYENMSEKAFYEFVSNAALMYEEFGGEFKVPGLMRGYSSAGTALAGELVARAHGMSYEQYVQTKLLDPLKMSGSFLSLPCAKTRDCSQLALVYYKDRMSQPWQLTKHRTAPFAKGTGRMKTTAVDMEKFLRANLNPESTPIAKTLKRGQTLIPDVTKIHNSNICKRDQDPDKANCNIRRRDLYWAWSKDRRRSLLKHSGATSGSQAMLAFTQDGRFGVVVLQNSIAGRPRWATKFGMCIMQVAGMVPPTKRCEAFDGTAR